MIVLTSYLSNNFTYKIIESVANRNYPKFPCKICPKNVSDKVKAVQCDLCELWVHIKCNNLNYLDYRIFKTATNPVTA